MKSTSKNSTPSLGSVIKAERTRQGLSLDSLARISDVSKGMLSQIEQGKTNPTVAVLYKVAAGLHVDPSRLLPQRSNTPKVWRIIRADDERYVFLSNQECRIRTLSPLNLEKQIEFYEITFPPKGSLVSEPHYQGTEEILAVSRGQLRVNAGETEVILKAGDSVHYAADITHGIYNLSPSPSVAFLIVRYHN